MWIMKQEGDWDKLFFLFSVKKIIVFRAREWKEGFPWLFFKHLNNSAL